MLDSKRLDPFEHVHCRRPVETKLVQPKSDLDTPVSIGCILSQGLDFIHDPITEYVAVNLEGVMFPQSRAGTEAKHRA